MASSTSSTATATMVTALRRFALRGLRKRGGVGGGCVASRAAILASQSSAVVKVGVGDAQGEAGGGAGGEKGVPRVMGPGPAALSPAPRLRPGALAVLCPAAPLWAGGLSTPRPATTPPA